MRTFIWILFWFLTAVEFSASARFLQIVGESQLHLSREAGALLIKGIYLIENRGDEPAQNVFPTFQLDQSQLTLDPQTVSPGQKISWDIEWRIPLQNLCQNPNDKCPLSLPDRGQFLLQVLNHYRDRNGYSFSVSEPLEIISEDSPGETPAKPQIYLKIQAQEHDLFLVNYRIFNPNSEARKFALRVLIPDELRFLNHHLGSVNIEPQSEIRGNFQIQNQMGLPGSGYQVILSAEWNEKDQRATASGMENFQLSAVKTLSKNQIDFRFWGWFFISSALGLICMWIFWIRPLKKI